MLYILVPVFNRIQSTERFLASLKRQSYKDYKVVIINDGSTDNTELYLNNFYPEVKIVRGSGNLFWGGAINLGLDYIEGLLSKDDILAFANNDIEFEEYTIENILHYYLCNKNAAYHPVTVNKDWICESSGSIVMNWIFFISRHPYRYNSYGRIKGSKPERVDFATARFLLFNPEVLKYVNRIDTKNFPHYGGDNDFSISLKKYKILTYVIPSSVCILDTTTTGNNPKVIKSIPSFIESLSSIKSTNNLRVRFAIGKKHCPKKYLLFYYISVLIQIVILNIRKK